MFKRPHIAGLGLSLALCGALVAAIAYSWQPPAAGPASVLPAKPLTITELRSEETGEYKRVHFLRGNGSKMRTDIVYRQGGTGVILYRPDETRSSFVHVTAQGWTRINARFDLTGQFAVDGFELRADKTRKWEAKTLPSGEVETLTYWGDGVTVFADQVRNLKGDQMTTVFRRADGTLWARQWMQKTVGGMQVEEDQFWPNQNLKRTLRWPGYEPVVKHFREDGSLYFAQKYSTWSDEGGSSLLLDYDTVYGAASGLPSMKIGFLFGSPTNITVYHANGTSTEHHYMMNGKPQALTFVDGNGARTIDEDAADPNLLKSLDPLLRNAYIPQPEDFFAQWIKAEPK
jgi:hypothetical protein